VPIWVSEPMGLEIPCAQLDAGDESGCHSAHAGIMIPSLPFTGAIWRLRDYSYRLACVSVRFVKDSKLIILSYRQRRRNYRAANGPVCALCGDLRIWRKAMAQEKLAVVTGSSSGIGCGGGGIGPERISRGGYHARSGTQRQAGRRAQKAGVRDPVDLRRVDITEVIRSRARSRQSSAITAASMCW